MLRRGSLLGLVALCVLLAASPALSAPRMSAAERQEFGRLVDRFVKDVVLRRNLVDGWTIAGPDLRGGTTRRAWVAGRGVTVAAFPAIGRDFSHAWTGKLVSPTEAELTVTLHSRGRNAEVTGNQVTLRKLHGRWVVDIFYPSGIIRIGKGHSGSCGSPHCSVSGSNDFGPGSSSPSEGVSPASQARWLWIVLGSIFGLVLALGLGLFLRIRRRDRRARLSYEASRLRTGRL